MTTKVGDIIIGENSGMVVLAQDSDLIAFTIEEAHQIGNVLIRLAEEGRKTLDMEAADADRIRRQ